MSAAAVERPRVAPPSPSRLLGGLRSGRAATLDEHLRHYGPLEARPASLLAALEASGLTGRGGAAFPTATKVRAVAAAGRRPIVVVNAAEGEPSSAKDKLLLRRLPHLVLDGAVALASALGARQVVIVHAGTAIREAAALHAAIAERRARRLDPRIELAVQAIPDGFVSGQETAIVQFLNGGPALPTFAPPLPFESGVGKRPTLVQNAETVAQVALVARHGAAWFRQLGTSAEPGSRLFTITGAVARPGVYEAEIGASLQGLVAAAGGLSATPRAFLVGGYAACWIDARPASSLTLDEASLRALGGTLGVGSISVLPDTACGLCETARVARHLAGESARQCGPCVHGLDAIATRLERPSGRGAAADAATLLRWAGQVTGRGACRHPDGAARFVASAVRVFEPELRTHDPARCAKRGERVLPIPKRGLR